MARVSSRLVNFDDRPLTTSERGFLWTLGDAEGGFVMARDIRQRIAGCVLVQTGHARRHPIYPEKFAITPRGEHYRDRLARAH